MCYRPFLRLVVLISSFAQCSLAKKIEPVEADNTEGGDGQKQPKKWFRALVDLKIDSSAGVGRHMLRLVSPRGISAGHPFVVTADPVVLESRSAHGDPEHAQPLEVPTLLAGKLWEKGEVDFYSFHASPGEEIVFRAVSNQATPVNGGGFDAMQFTVYEPGGTWFAPSTDTSCVKQLATAQLQIPQTWSLLP